MHFFLFWFCLFIFLEIPQITKLRTVPGNEPQKRPLRRSGRSFDLNKNLDEGKLPISNDVAKRPHAHCWCSTRRGKDARLILEAPSKQHSVDITRKGPIPTVRNDGESNGCPRTRLARRAPTTTAISTSTCSVEKPIKMTRLPLIFITLALVASESPTIHGHASFDTPRRKSGCPRTQLGRRAATTTAITTSTFFLACVAAKLHNGRPESTYREDEATKKQD